MAGFLKALAISIVLHCLIALGLAVWIDGVRKVELATLDVSAVEISFAEQESEFAPPVQMPSSPSSIARPEVLEPPHEPLERSIPLPPDPLEPEMPEFSPEELPEMERVSQESSEAAVAPRQARIDAPAKPIKSIRPDYPKGARQRGESGDVVLEIRISATGSVESVAVVNSSGYPELDNAAVKAVLRAPFTPARSEDGAVASTARLTVAFKIK